MKKGIEGEGKRILKGRLNKNRNNEGGNVR